MIRFAFLILFNKTYQYEGSEILQSIVRHQNCFVASVTPDLCARFYAVMTITVKTHFSLGRFFRQPVNNSLQT